MTETTHGSGPQVLPPQALADLLLQVLMQATEMSEEQALQFIERFRTQPAVGDFITQNAGLEALVKSKGPTIAAQMDDYLGKYGIVWGGRSYSFKLPQQKEHVPVEDINSTRQYCVSPQLSVLQMLFNLGALLRRLERVPEVTLGSAK